MSTLNLICLQETELNLGYTFSFPVQQSALNRGSLLAWTKGFSTQGVEGQEVVALTEAALGRRPGLKGKAVVIKALVNDTVGTLASAAYRKPGKCKMGVILGMCVGILLKRATYLNVPYYTPYFTS